MAIVVRDPSSIRGLLDVLQDLLPENATVLAEDLFIHPPDPVRRTDTWWKAPAGERIDDPGSNYQGAIWAITDRETNTEMFSQFDFFVCTSTPPTLSINSERSRLYFDRIVDTIAVSVHCSSFYTSMMGQDLFAVITVWRDIQHVDDSGAVLSRHHGSGFMLFRFEDSCRWHYLSIKRSDLVRLVSNRKEFEIRHEILAIEKVAQALAPLFEV